METLDDMAWLAGILEGEGSFGSKKKNGLMNSAVILSMKDADTIEKAAALMDGKIKAYAPRKNTHSPIFSVNVYGDRARSVMRKILPFMGERRSARIRQVLQDAGEPFSESFSDFKSLSEKDVFSWMVGLLEGEGAFLRAPPSHPNKPRVCLQMTDGDIVERFSAIVGRKSTGWDRRPVEGKTYKKVFICTVTSRKAMNLMEKISPHMSQRRKEQISAALDSYNPLARKEADFKRRLLCPEALLGIKASLLEGKSCRFLSGIYSVDKETIRYAIRNLIDWSDVPIPPKVQRTLDAQAPFTERKRLNARVS
jgi:hypothetical protein